MLILLRYESRSKLMSRSGGGSDTVGSNIKDTIRTTYHAQTAATMAWFMLAMITHPEKQRKCQEELERVVGRSRMPTFKDQYSLPYIRATVRELLRWRPITPVGKPCPR